MDTKSKLVTLPHGIKVRFNIKGAGTCESGLHINDPGDEDPKQMLGIEEQHSLSIYNAQIDMLESIILAQACAGVNIENYEYNKAITTIVDAIQNNNI